MQHKRSDLSVHPYGKKSPHSEESFVTVTQTDPAATTSGAGSRPVRIGVIGCGRIAQAAHLQAIPKSSAVELVAVADPSPDLSEGVARQFGVQGFTDSDELLKADIEAVVVATPDRFHYPLGVAALKAGKHVLMEKPLAATSAEAEELVKLAAERDLRLQTGAMKRHDPGLDFAHQHLSEIGDIVTFTSIYRIPAQRSGIEATVFPPLMVVDSAVRTHEDSFKAQKNRAAYLLATHGAHVFDQLVYFAGEPRWISVQSAVVGQDYTWHGTVGLPSGGLGSFEMTVDVHADASEGFEIFGTKGHIKASTFQPFWKRASEVEVYLEDSGVSLRPHPRDTNAFKVQIDDFAAAVLAGGGENPSPEQGVWAVRLIEAAARSVDLGGEKVAL